MKIGEKGKVSVKCLIKGWRMEDEGFRSKDLHRQEIVLDSIMDRESHT